MDGLRRVGKTSRVMSNLYNTTMWKNILNQLNTAILANWQWLLALLVGIVIGAANCGGVADLIPLAEAVEG